MRHGSRRFGEVSQVKLRFAAVLVGFLMEDSSRGPTKCQCLDAKANISLVKYKMHIRSPPHCVDTLILRRRLDASITRKNIVTAFH